MENKKTKIISIASIIALALTLVTATFAYFMAQTGEGKSTDIKINANTVDTFTFATGSAISLSMNQQNFASGSGNQTGTTYAKAMLTANNKTNTATEHYYMYLFITGNDFTYTQNENTPEILLTIKDASGNAITSITGLTYKTVTDGKGVSLSGFDITNQSGLLTLFSNREIATTSTKTEEWNVTVIFVNYDADQSANAGKSFSAKLLIQKEEYKIPTLAEYVLSQYTGTQGDNGIYYHNSTLTNGAGDNSYRYTGGDYQVSSKATIADLNYVIASSSSATDGVVNMHCGRNNQVVGSLCSSTKYYTLQYDTTNTQYTTYTEALEKATTDGYLTKDNIKNFVCFGTTTSPCPTDNLYRIIGVIDGKVKLIKYDYATSSLLGTDGGYNGITSDLADKTGYRGVLTTINYYTWTGSGTNAWSESKLNKVNLNTNFLNNIGTTWANKIATTTWKVGGNTSANIRNVVPATAYQNEIVNSVSTDNTTTYEAKIGLMYVSDYGFAANPNAWSLTMYDYNDTIAKSTNWMYMGYYDWTISRSSDYSDRAFFVNSPGHVIVSTVDYNIGVRASFNLESSVTYVSGSGTMSDPIRIN